MYEDVTLAELSERALELTIWDHDRLASNEFLGGVRFSLGTGKFEIIHVGPMIIHSFHEQGSIMDESLNGTMLTERN